MLFDQPINLPNLDDFERDEFAKHITSFLCLPQNSPSIVVAIEGGWGTGKTSCINLIKNHLRQKEDKPIIVEFNPWLIGSLDSVIEGFLIQFATSINQDFKSKQAVNAAAKILNLAKFLAPIKLIPGVEPWGTMVEKILDSIGKSVKAGVDMVDLSLSAKKKSVEDAIIKLKHPIIVIVDDIDRLPPQEIRVVFQVIKAVCNFERVSYLLAYDSDPISKALSYDDTYNGRHYLEKIVQISYSLPRIGYMHLKNFLKKQLDSTLKLQKRNLHDYEKSALSEALTQTGVVRSLLTPRNVIRLVNRLQISGERTENEVNFADVLLFEAISLMYPKIAQAIRREPQKFLQTDYFDEDCYIYDPLSFLIPKEADEKDKFKQFTNTLIQNHDLNDQENIRSILSFLFPRLLDNVPCDKDKALIENRICTKEALQKLLNCGLSSFTFSNKDTLLFIESDKDREQMLLDLLESDTISEWFNYLEPFIKKSNKDIINPISFCLHLLKISKKAYQKNKNDLSRQVGDVFISLLKSIPKDAGRKEVLNGISSNQINLYVSEYVLVMLLKESGMWSKGVYYSPAEIAHNQPKQSLFEYDDLVSAKDAWLNVVRNAARNEEDIIKNEQEPLSIFFRWGQFNNNNFCEVKLYISTTIKKHGIDCFLSLYPPGKGFKGIELLIDDQSKFMKELEQIKNKLPIADAIIEYLKKLENDKKDEQV